MNLKQFRKMFREMSGRFDLVGKDYADSGVGNYIGPAIKFLDRLEHTQKSFAVSFKSIAIGDISTTFPYCRAIKEVWAASPTSGRWQLEKKKLQDLMDGYLSTLPAEMNQGVPLYYAPCITRVVPKADTPTAYEEKLSYISVASNEYNAILLNVPTSEAISLIIHGMFYSPELTADTDSNYWSEVHPLLLYMSTMRYIEVVNRNTQGVNDWTSSILTDMRQLGMDLVEEDIAEADQMGE